MKGRLKMTINYELIKVWSFATSRQRDVFKSVYEDTFKNELKTGIYKLGTASGAGSYFLKLYVRAISENDK